MKRCLDEELCQNVSTIDHASEMLKAYVTYVRLFLEYCSPVWSPHCEDLIDEVEKVQRFFTKQTCWFAKIVIQPIKYFQFTKPRISSTS